MSNLYNRGETILLYVKFKDQNGQAAKEVVNANVSIYYEKNGQLVADLEKANLQQWPGTNDEYFYSLQISYDAAYGIRDVVYTGEIEGKVAQVIENFHVIPNNSYGENVIKVYGLVNQLRAGYPLISAGVKVSDGSEVYSETFTKEDGSWECFLYPGQYTFSFTKAGFQPQELIVQIGDEQTEIRFSNVSLESISDKNRGNGVYTITDKYQTKHGVPLNGLEVKAFNIMDMIKPAAEDTTNDDGEWSIYLDPGIYLLKITGKSMGEDYNYTFRLKVNDEGEPQFENLTSNVAVASEEQFVGRGEGTESVIDYVTDALGNPIPDVQVNVFYPHDLETLVAQDYTDAEGKWMVKLNKGNYKIEFYHPEFNSFMGDKTV